MRGPITTNIRKEIRPSLRGKAKDAVTNKSLSLEQATV